MTKAKIELSEAVVTAVQKHGLTYAELVSIFAEILQSWSKFVIRDERANGPEQAS